jgi:hypothetical protein
MAASTLCSRFAAFSWIPVTSRVTPRPNPR